MNLYASTVFKDSAVPTDAIFFLRFTAEIARQQHFLQRCSLDLIRNQVILSLAKSLHNQRQKDYNIIWKEKLSKGINVG